MKRRALIVYCDNAIAKKLNGPLKDYENYHDFLTSRLGGAWYDSEIRGLNNPHPHEVRNLVANFLTSDIDYSFVVFTGHGFINTDDGKQYIGLKNEWVAAEILVGATPKQTLILDACREHESLSEIQKQANVFLACSESYNGDLPIYRRLFDDALQRTANGLTVLYATGDNSTALDTTNGAAYLNSLLLAAECWESKNSTDNILPIDQAQSLSISILKNKYAGKTKQQPAMNEEKRLRYYPFAVKLTHDNLI